MLLPPPPPHLALRWCEHLHVGGRLCYGVALVSRIDKIIGLCSKRALQKRKYSAKEICNFIDPTDHRHPIV